MDEEAIARRIQEKIGHIDKEIFEERDGREALRECGTCEFLLVDAMSLRAQGAGRCSFNPPGWQMVPVPPQVAGGPPGIETRGIHPPVGMVGSCGSYKRTKRPIPQLVLLRLEQARKARDRDLELMNAFYVEETSQPKSTTKLLFQIGEKK